MLALQKTAPRPGLELIETSPPEPSAQEVLIEVEAAGICGSDLHVADWIPSYAFVAAALPVTLGHEFAGRIVAAGSAVTGLEKGARVVVMPSVTCGTCEGCRSGGPDHCTNRKGIGMTRHGAFAAFVVSPAANCLRLPDGLSFELAALTEPLTVSAQSVATGDVKSGDRVLIMGPGTIGQGIALMARRAGAREVVVSGMNDAARFATLRALGCERLVDMGQEDAQQDLARLAAGGFDVVFEATGAPRTIEQGLSLLKAGGVLVVTGIHSAPAQFDPTLMVRRALQIRGSYRSPRALWPQIVAMLAGSPSEFAPMITHRLPLSRALEGFALAHSRDSSKIMLFPQQRDGEARAS